MTIPASVTSIGENAFANCTRLTWVHFLGNAPSFEFEDVFANDNNATIYYLPEATGFGTTFGDRPTASCWSSPLDYVKLTTEIYQDMLGYNYNKHSFIYPTGSFTINAILFSDAGLSATNLTKTTSVEITIGSWSYHSASNTLSNDLGYKSKATKAKLPLTYQDSTGHTKSAGTATLGFGKNSVTLTITSKAGQDAQQDPIQNFIAANILTGGAAIGKTITTNDTISATITIGDYSETFTNIVLTGTDAAKNAKAKDGTTYRLDTVKIKGVSQ